MDSRKIFTTKMFPTLLIPVSFVVIFTIIFVVFRFDFGTIGINKTVGWAWDLTDLNVLVYPLYLVYLLGYGVLFSLRIKTGYTISVSHFIAIFIGFTTFRSILFQNIKALFIIISFGLFVANLISSVVNHQKIKRPQI